MRLGEQSITTYNRHQPSFKTPHARSPGRAAQHGDHPGQEHLLRQRAVGTQHARLAGAGAFHLTGRGTKIQPKKQNNKLTH